MGLEFKSEGANCSVTIVSSPYCIPCSKVHRGLNKLLRNNLVNLKIIFTVSSNLFDDFNKPIIHFMSMYQKYENHIIEDALNKWYTIYKMDLTQLEENYPIEIEIENISKKMELMFNWCKAEKVNKTPTIFIE